MSLEIPEVSEIPEIDIEVNLSTRLNRVLSLAMDEACSRKLRFTNTALVLLAMPYRGAVEGDGIGVQILKHLGVPLDRLVTEVRAHVDDQSQDDKFKDTKFAFPVIRALDLAVGEAGRFYNKLVDTGHLLLGIIQVKNEPIAAILDSFGVTLKRARKAVKEVFA